MDQEFSAFSSEPIFNLGAQLLQTLVVFVAWECPGCAPVPHTGKGLVKSIGHALPSILLGKTLQSLIHSFIVFLEQCDTTNLDK